MLWGLVALLTILRLVAAYTLPITGDEAYYWEWSRHLAAGYVDHPAGVAWTVAAFQWLGHVPGAVRFGFWLCGLLTTVALADCAARFARQAGGDPGRAALVAALGTTVVPMFAIAFGTVSPDGPFLAAWACTLDAAAACLLTPGLAPALATGVALGVALESRAFGVALLLGVCLALRHQRRWVVCVAVTAGVLALPLLYWNATHGWATVVFTLWGRHTNEGFALWRPLVMLAEVVAVLGIGPALLVARASWRPTCPPLLLWTSLPLVALLLTLSLWERVETYWLLGPYLSLTVVAALRFAQAPLERRPLAQIAALIPSLGLIALLYLLVFAAFPCAHLVAQRWHVRLHRAGFFDMYAMPSLALAARQLVVQRHAVLLTDGYGLSSQLDFYGSIPPTIIGYDWQGREARAWRTSLPVHQLGLFLDKVPLSERPDFRAQLARACTRVVPGPVLAIGLGDIPAARFSTAWCIDMKPQALTILRWESVS